MIDLGGVAANALWIVGLAVVLAALSLAYWRAQQERRRLRQVLRERAAQLPLAVGLALFSAGLAASDERWWARLLWGLLAVLWIWQGLTARRGEPADPSPAA